MYKLTKEEKYSFMIGAVLGDGSLTGKKNKGFMGGHSASQLSYLEWKSEMIRHNFPVTYKIKENEYLKKKHPNRQVFHQMWTTSHHKLTAIYKRIYDFEGKKHISEWALQKLTPLGLAVLFMDDGCKETRINKDGTKKIRSYKLSLNSFPLEEVNALSDWMLNNYGIESKVYLERKKHPILKITTEDNRMKFKHLIENYVHETMMYKLYI